MIKAIKRVHTIIVLLVLSACVQDKDFEAPKSGCVTEIKANTSFAEVTALYKEETIQIHEDLILEGYVVSSDEAGNFFSVLHIQDSPMNPKQGFQIEIDVRDSHLFYPLGSKVYIKLKGLYLGKSKEVYKLGGVFTSFGNKSVGRLPAAIIHQHVFNSCEGTPQLLPTQIAIKDLSPSLSNTLVQFDNLEFITNELNQTFAIAREETTRTLINCADQELKLLNSGFSEFQKNLLPEGKGAITGVLLRENEDYFLAIRTLDEINFLNERCQDLITEFSSANIFISEIADPNNNAKARFIELFYTGNESLPLNGWSLRRYTNANTEVSSVVDLSEFTIDANKAFVIAANAEEFKIVYGFEPNLEVTGNSAANSNGDDTMVLVDPFGTVIDVFGLVGEDGTGTSHEFEDGRALRKATIKQGNATYTFSEWDIYNDSGDAGTINQTQNAPEDFTPGKRD